MKRNIFVIITILLSFLVYAEGGFCEPIESKIKDKSYNQTIESVQQRLSEGISNIKYNELVYLYERLGWAFFAGGNVKDPIYNINASLEYYNKAEQLIKKFYNPKDINQDFFIQYYGNYGLALLEDNSIFSSEEKLLITYNISKNLSNKYYEDQTLSELVGLYWRIGDYKKVIWAVNEKKDLGLKNKNDEDIFALSSTILGVGCNSNIEFAEDWGIKNYNDTFYLVKIQLHIINNYNFNFSNPVIDWSFHSFKQELDFRYEESNIEGEGHPIFSNIQYYKYNTSSGFPIKKIYPIERVYIFPQIGTKLISNKIKEINISFRYPKENLNIFASRNMALLKDLRVDYQKSVKIYSNDDFFSEFPSESWIGDDFYIMYFNKTLIGTKPYSGILLSHNTTSYFPYINTGDSHGTIFGLNKPLSKSMTLKEEIKLKNVDNNMIKGVLSHKERVDFKTEELTKRLNANLFFVGDNIRDINIKPIEEIKIKEPILAKLNEYYPKYQKNQAYISNKEGQTRYLFFWIDLPKKDVEFEIEYPIDLSNSLKQINEHTWKLQYLNIFYSGEFPLSDRQYTFILPSNYKILESSPEGSREHNKITFNSEDFKLRDWISFTFKDEKLEQELIDKNLSNIKTSIWVITILFNILLVVLKIKYKTSKISYSLSLLIPILLQFTRVAEYFPSLSKIKYYYVAISFIMIYGTISFYLYKSCSKNE